MATIYIVEDDINIREIERYALKNSGYEVEEFEGSASFLSVWKKYPIPDPFRYHASGGRRTGYFNKDPGRQGDRGCPGHYGNGKDK